MIRVRLSQKVYLIVVFTLLACVCLGFIATSLWLGWTNSGTHEEGRLPFYARLITEFNPQNPKAALEKMREMQSPDLPSRFLLLDADGKVLFPEGATVPFSWKDFHKPEGDYEITLAETPSLWWPSRPPSNLIRLPGNPPIYLAGVQRYFRSTPEFFYWTAAALVISILVGIALSFIFLTRALHKKIILADSVLEEMRKGNLKARFPIRKMDEIGQAMLRFNTMADEIERLVEQISSADQSRMKLLQELTHDLRTPVASLKNLLETLNSDQLTKELREELGGLAMKEVDYFERLVEDLLILAQVTEPRFIPGHDKVLLGEFVIDEAESRWGQSRENQALRLSQEIDPRSLVVSGDSHLLRRMLRNALDNALSFAQSEIRISVQSLENREALILIEDDGPGFSIEALASFGSRRISRRLENEKQGRLSVGLGSVIMKNIAQLHRGSIEISNRELRGQVQGGQVRIRLPLESVS